MQVRIAKLIASSGHCSRRDAEKLVFAGKVRYKDQIITDPATKFESFADIYIEDKLISPPEEDRLWLYYKPSGLITTHRDPGNRPTIFEYLKDKLPRVISVGRLDLNSEGLILLTTSGSISSKLEHPSFQVERVYHVKSYGEFDIKRIEKALKEGIEIETIKYKPIKIKLLKCQSRNAWFELKLTEGKNREIRNIFEYFSLQISRLIRVSYGPFLLDNMKENDIIEIKNLKEILANYENNHRIIKGKKA